MKKLTSLLLVVAFSGALTLTPLHVQSQATENRAEEAPAKAAGKIRNSYRAGQQGARPAWVEQAHKRSLAHLKQNGRRHGIEDAEAELALLGVDEDDLGQTHVRHAQVYKGVPVFGGQLITHLDAKEGTFANGRVYKDARAVGTTTPKLAPAAALARAKEALNYTGAFERETVELVLLPEAVKRGDESAGATLVYKVELLINDGSPETARHFYFVNARTGEIEWHYDNLQRSTGLSQHSGTVSIETFFNGSFFEMNDRSRSDGRICGSKPGIITSDAASFNRCAPFADADDTWGDGTGSNRQTAGVDAHFGAKLTYDYYLGRHGRRSLDNNNHQLCNRVHDNSRGIDQAYWDGQCTNYGSGSNGRNWASVDVVGHEYTHGVTEFSANLIYSSQSGGSNESFSDIFGTMIEYYGGINPDYTIGEDINGGLRSMSTPRVDNRSIDHISQYFEGMDVHYSSGLQNVAFYLLAEGGAHPSTFVNVKRVGRDRAAAIYYRALTVYLFPSARFSDVRFACLRAASDLFSTGNPIYHAVVRSWFSTGVGGDVPFNPIDDPRSFANQHYRDFLNREGDEGGLNFWTGTITECGNDAACEDLKRIHLSRAFWNSGDFQSRPDVQSSGLLTPGTGRPYDNRQFVRWCYINYLRRDPASPNATQQDRDGWDFWTNTLNGHGDYNETIRAFLLSTDYRARFGPA